MKTIEWEWNWFTITITVFAVYFAFGVIRRFINDARGIDPMEKMLDHTTRIFWNGERRQ